MKRAMVSLLLGSALLATPAFAQHANWRQAHGSDRGERGAMGRFLPEDQDAFADARLAALHAGLKLSPDQEKLWPPVEQAIRALTAQHREQMSQIRDMRRNWRADFPTALRATSDREAARADGLRRLADAVAPLYATLDESQKHRATVLMRRMRPHEARLTTHDGTDRHWRWHHRNG